VHDTTSFETQGLPSVFAASSEFVDAADVQSRALGLPEVPRVIVPHPIQDATDEEMGAKADAALEAILRALTDGDHS
jgi:hypothetical protein